MPTETHLTFVPQLADLIPAFTPDAILSRTVHQDGGSKVTIFGFAAGQSLSEHTAAVPAIVHILQGEGTLTLGTESHDVTAGAWAHMPAHLPHSITARTPLIMLLIMLKG